MSVLYLGLGFDFTGGIATMAKAAVEIIARYARAHPALGRMEIVTLHGARSAAAARHGLGSAAGDLEVRGCGGERLTMVRRVAPMMRGGCSLVICEHVNLMPLVAAFAPRGLPCLCWIYSLEVWNGLSLVRRRALRRADRLLVLAEASRRRTQELLPELKSLSVCYPGVSAPLRAVEKRQPDSGTILTVGRIVQAELYKGQDALIAAMPQVVRALPDARLVIVGEGDGKSGLMHMARELGIDGAVHFTGELSPAELDRCYRDAALFAMPARLEGFGLVYAEAMAYGLPVLAGDCDTSPEIVEHGRTGWLVAPHDTHALAQRIIEMLSRPELARAMGAAGRRRYERLFTPRAFEQRLWRELDSLAGNGPTTPGARRDGHDGAGNS